MKHILAILVVSWLSVVSAGAEPKFSFGSSLLSQYLGGNGAVFHDKPVLQSNLTISGSSGFYVDLWWSTGLDDSNFDSNFGDEADVTLAWAGELARIGVDLGVTYITISPIDNLPQDDLVDSFIKMSKGFSVGQNSLSPYAKLEKYLSQSDALFGGGTHLRTGMTHSWQFNKAWNLGQDFYALRDFGAFGNDPGWLGSYSLALNWQARKNLSVTLLRAKASDALSGMSDRDLELAYGCGVSGSF
ncbi:MAG: hypothetical protein V1895_01840 [Parcubacteria group bacterium]